MLYLWLYSNVVACFTPEKNDHWAVNSRHQTNLNELTGPLRLSRAPWSRESSGLQGSRSIAETMLHIRMMSGEEVASIPMEEVEDVRTLKQTAQSAARLPPTISATTGSSGLLVVKLSQFSQFPCGRGI